MYSGIYVRKTFATVLSSARTFSLSSKIIFSIEMDSNEKKRLNGGQKRFCSQKFKRSPAVGGFHQENISRKLEFVPVTQN